jgi:superfamily II DNA helicase RecQ
VLLVLPTGELSNVQSAVVYVGFRYAADALAAQLKRAGINSAAYHAGLAYDQREFVQVRAQHFPCIRSWYQHDAHGVEPD